MPLYRIIFSLHIIWISIQIKRLHTHIKRTDTESRVRAIPMPDERARAYCLCAYAGMTAMLHEVERVNAVYMLYTMVITSSVNVFNVRFTSHCTHQLNSYIALIKVPIELFRTYLNWFNFRIRFYLEYMAYIICVFVRNTQKWWVLYITMVLSFFCLTPSINSCSLDYGRRESLNAITTRLHCISNYAPCVLWSFIPSLLRFFIVLSSVYALASISIQNWNKY